MRNHSNTVSLSMAALVGVLAAVAVAVAACSLPTTPGLPTPSSTAPATTTSTSPPADAVDDSKVSVALAIHIEGRQYANQAAFDAHVGELQGLRTAAEEHGGKITFEVGQTFLTAMERYGAGFLLDAVQHGHEVGLHADVGGSSAALSEDQFSSTLLGFKTRLEGLGFHPTHVSGICSASPWVEGARRAGFTTVNGLVEYCLKSLDPANLPAGYTQDWLDNVCTTPIRCHGEAPTVQGHRGWLWRTSDSGNWVVDDPDGEIVIVPAQEGGVTCQVEVATGRQGQCVAEAADLTSYEEQLVAMQAGLHQGNVTAFSQVLSIGPDVDPSFLDSYFALVDRYVDDGVARWSTVDEQAATER